MNRRNFLSKLAIGAAAVVVAPMVLIPKPEPTILGPAELLRMQKNLMKSIVDMPISQWGSINDGWWYSKQEMLAMLRMDDDFMRMSMFGERSVLNRKFYTGKGWISSL
jgi:CRISPR/Cas system CSM-associated protein Csm4 (group 5 of RAMP superfamily)